MQDNVIMFSGLGARVYFLSTFSTQLYRVLYVLWFNFEVPALYYSMYLTAIVTRCFADKDCTYKTCCDLTKHNAKLQIKPGIPNRVGHQTIKKKTGKRRKMKFLSHKVCDFL